MTAYCPKFALNLKPIKKSRAQKSQSQNTLVAHKLIRLKNGVGSWPSFVTNELAQLGTKLSNHRPPSRAGHCTLQKKRPYTSLLMRGSENKTEEVLRDPVLLPFPPGRCEMKRGQTFPSW